MITDTRGVRRKRVTPLSLRIVPVACNKSCFMRRERRAKGADQECGLYRTERLIQTAIELVLKTDGIQKQLSRNRNRNQTGTKADPEPRPKPEPRPEPNRIQGRFRNQEKSDLVICVCTVPRHMRCNALSSVGHMYRRNALRCSITNSALTLAFHTLAALP